MDLQVVSSNEIDNLEKIKQYDRHTNLNALILGKLLAENVEYGFWRKLGFDSFTDFISQGGFSFTKRSAYNYIELWKLFVKFAIEFEEFVSIPYSKILKIKDVINEENLEEWLGKAKTLSRTDLELELKEIKAQSEGREYKVMPKIYLCKDCGGWVIDLMASDICGCGKSMLKGEDLIESKMSVKVSQDADEAK